MLPSIVIMGNSLLNNLKISRAKEVKKVDNLSLYNKVKEVPKEAQKPIQGGRLAGFTDINPMWRIKTLTEQFGVVGFGWYYEILEEKIVEGANDEKVAFVRINLFIKMGEEWSKPIQGTGGSNFVAKEKNGLYTSDECLKMALTDAISVACKAIGIGADVYYGTSDSKYNSNNSISQGLSEKQVNRLFAIAKSKGYDNEAVKKTVLKKYGVTEIASLSKTQYDEAVKGFENAKEKA